MHISRKKLLIAAILIISAAVIASALWWSLNRSESTLMSFNSNLLSQLSARDNEKVKVIKTAGDVMPPTNSWISGAIFQEPAEPIFPFPHSMKLLSDGFEFGLPNVKTDAKTIFGSHTADVKVTIQNASSYVLTSYDSMVAKITYYSGGSELAVVTIVHGSPYVSIDQKDASVTYQITGEKNQSDSAYTSYRIDGANIGIVSTTSPSELSTNELRIPARQTSTIYAYTGETDRLKDNALNGITESNVSYSQNGDSITTTYELTTSNGKDTALVSMPNQDYASGTTDSTYQTIYGEAKLSTGTSFTRSTPKITASSTLDYSKLTDADKQQLRQQLAVDSRNLLFDAPDTYFGGKQLYKAANMLELAEGIGDDATKRMMVSQLNTEFDMWFDPSGASKRDNKYFYYDRQIKGIVGAEASFGSDEFNDHHFHYGYFIYAASVLSKYDQDFERSHGDFVDLLVADVASLESSKQLPKLRTFDQFTGHGWASGFSPFGDGNNQESSSEAINAWTAISLWSSVREDDTLKLTADAMAASELRALNEYWLHFDPSDAVYNGYSGPVVTLNWGGKRDYATFFSDDANAKFGILLIPMNPSFIALRANNEQRMEQNISASFPNDNFDKQFGDYGLMYRSLYSSGRENLTQSKSISDTNIDTANTRSYLEAWLMAVN